MEHSSLPIIDYAALGGAPEPPHQMLARLGQAAWEVGFCYLTSQGLSEAEQRDPGAGAAERPSNPLCYQVGENVLKGGLRSHPDVAARHYASSQGLSQGAVPRARIPA